MKHNNETEMEYKHEGTVVERLLESYLGDRAPFKTAPAEFHDRDNGFKEINLLKRLLFPNYWNNGSVILPSNKLRLGAQIHDIGQLFFKGIAPYIEDDSALPSGIDLTNIVRTVLEQLPSIRELLKKDVQAARDGDPAAKTHTAIIRTYPGFAAIETYRVAHALYQQGAFSYARELTEHAHSITGIDINPGAKIGESFFIDHGTGVVIGETTEIGNNVRIYQGVTLGALSVPTKKVEKLRQSSKKRHPTVEDNVIIYAGATILGGRTRIGKGSIIGGNVYLIKSVDPNSKIEWGKTSSQQEN